MCLKFLVALPVALPEAYSPEVAFENWPVMSLTLSLYDVAVLTVSVLILGKPEGEDPSIRSCDTSSSM